MIYRSEIECMDREQLRELQLKRLQETVAWEFNHVASYRSRMQEAGIFPEDIKSLDDLAALPFTEKTDLRDNFPFGLLAVPQREIVRIQGSSGTTGKPIVVGYTQGDVEVWTEMVSRALASVGAGPDDVVQIAYGYGLFTGGLGAHQGATALGAMVLPMSSGNTKRQLMMMQELGTTILCCTPSYAVYLGETAREMGLEPGRDLHLKAGVFGAEPWSEQMRKKIEVLLGIDAYDIYGLTEIAGPGVAFECSAKHGSHINEDHVIAEVVDPKTGKVLPYGEAGELVFTTITKKGQPALRYRTHDICILDDSPCSCGRTTLRMSRLMGRTDDMLVIRGVNVFPSQIETAIMTIKGLAPHYELVVDRVNNSDTLEVRVELTKEVFSDTVAVLESLRRAITDSIKSVVGISAKVSLVPPKSIQRSEGKAKRIIDKRVI